MTATVRCMASLATCMVAVGYAPARVGTPRCTRLFVWHFLHLCSAHCDRQDMTACLLYGRRLLRDTGLPTHLLPPPPTQPFGLATARAWPLCRAQLCQARLLWRLPRAAATSLCCLQLALCGTWRLACAYSQPTRSVALPRLPRWPAAQPSCLTLAAAPSRQPGPATTCNLRRQMAP